MTTTLSLTERPCIAIQRNRISGTGARRQELRALISALRAAGLKPRLFARRERLDAAIADPAYRDRLGCIVAAGGDGTIGDVVNRFPGIPVAILPLGTENLLARYLQIPQSGAAVAEMIVAGRTRRIDVCNIGGRRFTLMASFGFDADVVRRIHSRRKGNIRKLSYVQPIWEAMRMYPYPELRLYLDDDETPMRGSLAVIVNLPVYAMGLQVAMSAKADDGLLDLRVFERPSTFQLARYFYKVFTRSHESLADVRTARAARVRIESDQPVPIQVDGDPAGWTPTEISMLPGSLDVFIPAMRGCDFAE